MGDDEKIITRLNEINTQLMEELKRISELSKAEETITNLNKIISEFEKKVLEGISKLPQKEDLKTPSAFAEPAKDAKSLAIISERFDRVKEKLEAGGLKARDAVRLAKEYDKLEYAYDQLIDQL
jgi:hypothetical protein